MCFGCRRKLSLRHELCGKSLLSCFFNKNAISVIACERGKSILASITCGFIQFSNRSMSQVFKKIEIAIRSLRKKLLQSVFTSSWGRKQHWDGLGNDVVMVTRQLEDHKVTFNPHEFIGKYLYTKGGWERDSFDNVIRLLGENSLLGEKKVALELGANIGTQTIYLHLSQKFGKVVAVEADPNNGKLLRHNLEQNGLLEASVLGDCAISESDGFVDLYLSEGNQGEHSLIKSDKRSEMVRVEGKTLKRILDDGGVAPADVGFCWVDLEGFEFEALRQIIETLGSKVPVFTEFSPKFYGPEKAKLFSEYIKDNYKECYVFGKRIPLERVSTKEIPVERGQVDLLLLP